MSIEVIVWAMRCAREVKSPIDLLVLIAIAEHAHGDGGGSWAAVSSLARETRLSERQVRRSIARLKRKGVIAIEEKGGGRRTNTYRVLMNEAIDALAAAHFGGELATLTLGGQRGEDDHGDQDRQLN